MPRAGRRNAQLEKLLLQQQQSEHQITQLQHQLQQHNGHYLPPLHRPATQQWDWNCGACGRVVYTPKTRCNCNGPQNTRRFGATLVGSVRGRPQNTSAARQAATAQASVPTIAAPSYHVRRGGNAVTNQHLGAGGNAAPKIVVASAPVAVARGAAPAQRDLAPAVAELPITAAERMALDESSALPAEPPADDGERTMPEDMGSKAVNVRILNIERKLDRKRKHLAKEEQAISDQEAEIAVQQAKLVQLQSDADATREEIRGINEDRAELSQRLAKLNEIQHDENPRAASELQEEAQVQAAKDCLAKTFFGMQNYDAQPAAIKTMLDQFAQLYQGLQAEHKAAAGSGQLTLQQAFAAQAAASPPQPTTASRSPSCPGPTAVAPQATQHHDISSGSCTPTGRAAGPAEGISSYGRASLGLTPPTGAATPYARAPRSSLSSLSAENHSSPAVERTESHSSQPVGDAELDATAEADSAETADMAVVGHSAGDKRKLEHVEDLARIAKAEEAVGTEQDAMATDRADGPKTDQPAVGDVEGPTMARKDLCRQLREEAARSAARDRRSTPYGGNFHV